MNSDSDQGPKLEPWDIPDKTEGYDVYGYDALRAAAGQRIALFILAVALVAFVAALVLSARPSNNSKPKQSAIEWNSVQ